MCLQAYELNSKLQQSQRGNDYDYED